MDSSAASLLYPTVRMPYTNRSLLALSPRLPVLKVVRDHPVVTEKDMGIDDLLEILILKSDFETSTVAGIEGLVLTKSGNIDGSTTFTIYACELDLKTAKAK